MGNIFFYEDAVGQTAFVTCMRPTVFAVTNHIPSVFGGLCVIFCGSVRAPPVNQTFDLQHLHCCCVNTTFSEQFKMIERCRTDLLVIYL